VAFSKNSFCFLFSLFFETAVVIFLLGTVFVGFLMGALVADLSFDKNNRCSIL
jgi:hypothetical protein